MGGGSRQGEFASLVNPGVPVPPRIADLTGITDWMLAAAPRLSAVLPGLLDFARVACWSRITRRSISAS